jgi:hypothetical protein
MPLQAKFGSGKRYTLYHKDAYITLAIGFLIQLTQKELFGIQPEMRKQQKSQLQRYYLSTEERGGTYDSERTLQEFN